MRVGLELHYFVYWQNLVADSWRLTVVPELLSASGEHIDILHEFQRFFQSFYHQGPSPDLSSSLDTLWTLSLSTLSDEEAASLEADISIQEIEKAINSSPLIKLQGLMGYQGIGINNTLII